MKRWLVFAYEAYYPGGGWSDFKRGFCFEQLAIEYADSIFEKYNGGVEVIDLESEKDIYVYPEHRPRKGLNREP